MNTETKATAAQSTSWTDWCEIHHRLQQALAALDSAATAPPQDKKKILKARAHALAQEPEAVLEQEQLDIVEFLLAHERYAIESHWVREICPLKELTPLPGTPPFLVGLVNVRGRIRPVFDLKKFFDLPEPGLTDLHCIIFVRDQQLEIGLLADVIVGVRFIPRESLQPSLPTLTGIRHDYLKGVTAERLVVLDLARILGDPKIIIHEEVAN